MKLIKGFNKSVGRNNQGRITSRHRGGGHKRKFREVKFSFFIEDSIEVQFIEYDPNRSANLAKVQGRFGSTSYILACKGLKVGIQVYNLNSERIFLEAPRLGSISHLKNFSVGTLVYSVSDPSSGKPGYYVRAAGCSAQVVQKENNYVILRLPSGILKKFNPHSIGFVGQVGNESSYLKKLKKAGESRWRGIRPRVRGVAINPVDHPHGGGEGKSSGGRPSVSPWGLLSKGKKTRK